MRSILFQVDFYNTWSKVLIDVMNPISKRFVQIIIVITYAQTTEISVNANIHMQVKEIRIRLIVPQFHENMSLTLLVFTFSNNIVFMMSLLKIDLHHSDIMLMI